MCVHTISVVLTVFNLEECLEETLESLSTQTKIPYEVIIINDGSQDNSQKIINKFVNNNIYWKCLETANLGVASARNLGLSVCSGEYVIFLDGDDLFNKDLISRLSLATTTGPDIVVCRSREFDHLTKKSHKLSWAIRSSFLPMEKKISPSELKGSVCYTFMGWAWDKLFKKELLKRFELSFPNLRNSEDLVFVYPAVMLADHIEIVEEELILHRVSRSNSLSNSLVNNPFDFVEAISMLEAKIRSHPAIWGRERMCFIQWALDFYLWGERNCGQNLRLFPRVGKKLDGINRLKIQYLSSYSEVQYYPLLKLRLLIRSFPILDKSFSSLLYYCAFWKKFGYSRVLFWLFSKIEKKSRIFR